MSRRHVDTITDYVIVAISPILIMLMVGSLAFFLQQLFYQGGFDGRLRFATGLFVAAAVLIARISIQAGREYASMFALPLCITTILSMMKYTDLSFMFSVPLIAFIWWSTDKLTWDCTVLDDQKDASGEGLLQTVGMDGVSESETNLDREATTDAVKTEQQSLWQRWLTSRRRHHTPGVWVIYFGIAAIPLFGLGQLFMPSQMNGASFFLLCIYVASALALLMTTSFLQMRRYLIQRRLPFTDQMAATWLGTGGVIIAGLLAFCLLLPRPNTGYSVLDTISNTSPLVRKASRFSVGKEGTKDNEQTGQGDSEEDAETDSEQGRQTSERAKSGKKSGEQGDKGEKSGNQKGEGKEGKSGNRKQDGKDQSNNQQGDEQDSKQGQERDDDANSKRQDDNQSSDKTPGDEGQSNDGDDPGDSEQSESNSKGTKSSQPPKPPSSNLLPNVSLPPIPKLIYFAVVGLLVFFVMIKYGREIRAALRAFMRDMRDLLARLFGGQPRSNDEEEQGDEELTEVEELRPFSSYPDPFAMGTANRSSPQQLVTYTFEALQAWAHERDCGRAAEQTPLEFATKIGGKHRSVGPSARNLAMLYNQVAYAPGTIGSEATEHVQQLWSILRPGDSRQRQK